METIIFWTIWIIVSFWAIKPLYKYFSKERLVLKRPSFTATYLAAIILLAAVIWFVFYPGVNDSPNNEDIVTVVSKLPEVQEFRTAVEESGKSTFSIEIASSPTSQDPYYLIQVFETFSDHRTTFGWYKYIPESAKLYRQNIVEDSWALVE